MATFGGRRLAVPTAVAILAMLLLVEAFFVCLELAGIRSDL
jgi:hypothetical protein